MHRTLPAVVTAVAALVLALAFVLPAEAAKKKSRKSSQKKPVENTKTIDGAVPSYADRLPIHYHAEGAGSPAVVFVHCWTCNSGFWRNQVPEFAKTHRVVTLDLAGHGASGVDRKAFTMRAFAADVKAVVEALGLGKIVLVGHSMGGPVVLEAARIMPEHVAGVVLVDTLHDVDRKMTAEQREGFVGSLRTDFKAASEQLVRSIYPPDADADLVARTVAEMGATKAEVGIGAMEQLVSYDEAAALEAVKIPIVAINGDLFPTNVEANTKHNKNYELVLMKGVGHFPHLERPDEFNAKLREALGRFSR